LAEIKWHNEKRAIRDLIPYEVNPRQITNKQAKDLKASLAKFGIADPLIINTDNMIIGGHQRKKILETLLGYDPDYQIDVRVPDRELSIDEARELNVRLNKNVADWDFDILANNFELDDLLDWGFDKQELDLDLWAGDAPEDVEPQIDKAEELREKWGVESGQLWKLGEHRLICGDCTDKAVVERVMGGEKAAMSFVDPPYGIDYKSNMTKSGPKGWEYAKIENDNVFLIDWLPILCDVLTDKSALYLCTRWDVYPVWLSALGEMFKIKNLCVWVKHIGGMGDLSGAYAPQHEFIIYAAKGKHELRGKRETDVWDIPSLYTMGSRMHPTEKPDKLPAYAIEKSSDIGDIVCDWFLGSGPTLIACERLGRKCRAVEISPAYVAVAIQRWVDVTGKEPVLLES